jgi:hypothetical protein
MKDRDHYQKSTEQQRVARERMALFPADAEVLHVTKELWVVCPFPSTHYLRRATELSNNNVAYRAAGGTALRLPGRAVPIPTTTGWPDAIPSPPRHARKASAPPRSNTVRLTPHHAPLRSFRPCCCSMKESQIAPFLTALQERVKDEGIRIGSYPSFERGVTISLIGKSLKRLQELSVEVRGTSTFVLCA